MADAGATGLSDYLGTTALAIGALGTASFGIVDGLKIVPSFDLAGFERLFRKGRALSVRGWIGARGMLDPLFPALLAAYGSDAMELLRTQYRSGRSAGDLPRTIRQGARIGFSLIGSDGVREAATGFGLPNDTADRVSRWFGTAHPGPPAAGQSERGREAERTDAAPDDEARAALATFETAIDARIDAALSLAERQYVTQTKILATVVALGIAFGVGGYGLGQTPALCFLVGITAVPLAPVAKDLAAALQASVKALRGP